jgi:hypothetical protein
MINILFTLHYFILVYKGVTHKQDHLLVSVFSCMHVGIAFTILIIFIIYRVRVMVFNVTFNNISVLAWRSVLWVEETGVPEENHRHVASH